jgi:hypothetical protein
MLSLAAIVLMTTNCGLQISDCRLNPQSAISNPQWKPNPLAEKWVVEQVAAGQIADLEERFPDEADRVLSADFIQKLLTASLKDVEVPRQGVRIYHAVFVEPVDLENAEIPYETWLNESRFEDRLNFSKSLFRKDLSLSGSSLNAANFNSMKVGGSAFFNRAVFVGPVDFALVDIEVNFQADEAQFTHPEQEASFSGMKVGGSAFFNRAVFAGPVNFVLADVTVSFMADEARFTHPEHTVNFNSMKVGHTAFFRQAVFAGPVDFALADITVSFVADAARFTHPQQEVTFNGMRVGHTAFFRKAVFAGPVDFALADVGVNFQADEARFTNPEQKTSFDSMKVGQTAFFDKAVFAGPVSMMDASFFDLSIQGTPDSPFVSPLLDLSRTVVQRELRIEDLKLQALVATSLRVEGSALLRVEGSALFRRLAIEGTANLERSHFGELTLDEVSWPKSAASFRLDGMTYQAIRMGSERVLGQKLLELANRSAYSVQVYSNLMAFFRRQGYSEWADEVLVAQKRRERAEILTWNSAGWWWNLFLDLFVLYGLSPARVFLWSALFVVIGCLVFRRQEDMEPQRGEVASGDYNAFWYSLDLFLPYIDLRTASAWAPKPERRFARHYMRVHTLLGWLVIPIGLLALTGIIK